MTTTSDQNTTSQTGGFCVDERGNPSGIIIFGASGDLTHRKLLPSLFNLYLKSLLPEQFFVLGFARSDMNDQAFQAKVAESLQTHVPEAPEEKRAAFVKHCAYLAGNYQDAQAYQKLSQRLYALDQKYSTGNNRLFYLSTPPNLYSPIAKQLGAAGLTQEKENNGAVRVIFEKPFGRDLESAVKLDVELHQALAEHQIYRIDHYLGKETVQNILMLRFANAVFEPIWNRNYIDYVEITVAESLGVEHRAGYYEQSGQLRDMFQNHMMQMLCLVAMEPPISFAADRVRDEKIKLIQSIRPFDLNAAPACVVRGQYGKGRTNGQDAIEYRLEEGVNPQSQTETFVAARVQIDNWRWQGVPFYVRSGKRLNQKLSEIAIHFKNVPHSMFAPLTPEDMAPNVLVLGVYPEEGMSLTVQAKVPGPKICMSSLDIRFRYRDVFGKDTPEAYQRLLLDGLIGDQTLFWRHDGVMASWSLLTPVLRRWESTPDRCPLASYPAGSWGPSAADDILLPGHTWRTPEAKG